MNDNVRRLPVKHRRPPQQPPGLPPHPFQPLVLDDDGTVRFRENAIVTYLLDKGGLDMNHLAVQDFTAEDRQHFAQLIGYSVTGWGELHYVDKAHADVVWDAAMKLGKEDA